MPRIRQYADKYVMSDLSSHIKSRMEKSGIKQEDLAIKLKKSQPTISRLLNHPENMHLGMLRKICQIVETDYDVVMKAAWCEKK